MDALGPAICRLVIMELYEVEDGSRHDHVASMGLAKERVDAINRFAVGGLMCNCIHHRIVITMLA